MKNKKKKRKGFNASAMRCPYCGASVVYRSADGIYQNNDKGAMLYVCSHYPACDAYVRVHGRHETARDWKYGNRELRALRRTAHFYFDQMYQRGLMTKQEAYQWMANLIGAPLSQAHIGYLREYYCTQVIEESKKYLVRCHVDPDQHLFRCQKGGAIAS